MYTMRNILGEVTSCLRSCQLLSIHRCTKFPNVQNASGINESNGWAMLRLLVIRFGKNTSAEVTLANRVFGPPSLMVQHRPAATQGRATCNKSWKNSWSIELCRNGISIQTVAESDDLKQEADGVCKFYLPRSRLSVKYGYNWSY